MGDDDNIVEGKLLDTLVANTAALTTLTATVSNLDKEFVDGRKARREQANNLGAKLENLDRSIGEVKLASENAEKARQVEGNRIFDLLKQERKDRREAVTEGRDGERAVQKSESDLLRDMIREELGERRGDRKDNRHLLKTASTEVWKAGGKYIVAAIVIVILAGVMKALGMNLADIIGLAGK